MHGWLLMALAAWGQAGDGPPSAAPAPAGYPVAPGPPAGVYRPGGLRQSLERLREANEPSSRAASARRNYGAPPSMPTGDAAQPVAQPGANAWPVQLATYAEPAASREALPPEERSADAAAALPRVPEPTAAIPPASPAIVAAPARNYAPIRLRPLGDQREEAEGAAPRPSSTGSSIVTVVASLAIVLGLFFVVVWFLRRAAGAGPAALPADAVAILGQVPLSPRQNIHLLRVAHKLLVVCSNGETATTLTEIESAEEVERIAGLCLAVQPGSATNTFRDILTQIGSEPTPAGFLATSGGAKGGPFAGLGLGDGDD